jgi:hypothetical protein
MMMKNRRDTYARNTPLKYPFTFACVLSLSGARRGVAGRMMGETRGRGKEIYGRHIFLCVRARCLSLDLFLSRRIDAAHARKHANGIAGLVMGWVEFWM